MCTQYDHVCITCIGLYIFVTIICVACFSETSGILIHFNSLYKGVTYYMNVNYMTVQVCLFTGRKGLYFNKIFTKIINEGWKMKKLAITNCHLKYSVWIRQ